MLWTDMDRLGLLDPWSTLERLNRTAPGPFTPSPSEFPAVNIWVDGDRHVITSELPGIDPKDVEISVVGRTVTLRGTRRTDDPCEGECQHRRERWSGQFSRAIELPFLVDQEKVEAKFSKGVLELTVPRAEADKPRKITIRTE